MHPPGGLGSNDRFLMLVLAGQQDSRLAPGGLTTIQRLGSPLSVWAGESSTKSNPNVRTKNWIAGSYSCTTRVTRSRFMLASSHSAHEIVRLHLLPRVPIVPDSVLEQAVDRDVQECLHASSPTLGDS